LNIEIAQTAVFRLPIGFLATTLTQRVIGGSTFVAQCGEVSVWSMVVLRSVNGDMLQDFLAPVLHQYIVAIAKDLPCQRITILVGLQRRPTLGFGTEIGRTHMAMTAQSFPFVKVQQVARHLFQQSARR